MTRRKTATDKAIDQLQRERDAIDRAIAALQRAAADEQKKKARPKPVLAKAE
jgi:hypothetical protein